MLKLSEIYIYPVKSLGGIRLETANITTRGLENDRRFMLVDENGRFLSQREHPQLAIFKTEIEAESLKITNKKDGSTLKIFLQYSLNHKITQSMYKFGMMKLSQSKSVKKPQIGLPKH